MREKTKKALALIAAIILFTIGLWMSDQGSKGHGAGLILAFISGYIMAARHKIGGKKEQ